ncbi:MAG: outer membrane protein [Patiriisocius sp.]|jgi:outer membrane protein TolC
MKKYIFILCALYGIQGFAQDKAYSFTVEEAITFAIDSSYATINSRREIAKALKLKWEATAIGLPQIDANVSYLNNLKQQVSLLPAAAFDNTSSVVNTVEEFFDLEANGDPSPPEGFIPVIFGTKQSINATATLTQLIFDGSYLIALEGVKSFLEYNENINEKTNLEIRKQVINAYGNVLLAEEAISITEKNKSNVEKNLFETTKIFENGLTEEESVEQLKITLLDLETQLSNAKRTLGISKQLFNLTLGIDVNQNVSLTNTLKALTEENISLALLDNSLTIEENVDYKIAQNLTEQRDIELKLERSRGMPTMNGFINYGTGAFEDEFTFLNNDQQWFQSSSFGISLNVPIFSSGLRSARNQQAKISLDQAQTELVETSQRVQLAYETARSNYQFTIERYGNTKKNLTLAESIENKNQIKFKEGLASSFDLRQAQIQLYRIQQQYISAMLDVIKAKAEMETVLNTPKLRMSIDEIKNKYKY